MEHLQTVKPNKLFYRSINVVILSCIFLMVVFAYWLLYPYQTITANQQPFRILNEEKILKAGDILIYEDDLCNHMDGEVVINMVLVNDILVSFSPRTVLVEEGCRKYQNRSIELPDHLPDGKYHLEINLSMKVNPIRSETVKLKTEDFIVRNPLLELNHDADIGECLEDLCPALP